MELARSQSEPYIIESKDTGPGSKVEIYRKEDPFNLQNDLDCFSRMWQKGNKRGFIV